MLYAKSEQLHIAAGANKRKCCLVHRRQAKKKQTKKQLDESDDGINFGSVGKWKLSKEQTRSPSTQDSTQMNKDRPAFLNHDNDKVKRGGVILMTVTDGQGSVMYALLLCF